MKHERIVTFVIGVAIFRGNSLAELKGKEKPPFVFLLQQSSLSATAIYPKKNFAAGTGGQENVLHTYQICRKGVVMGVRSMISSEAQPKQEESEISDKQVGKSMDGWVLTGKQLSINILGHIIYLADNPTRFFLSPLSSARQRLLHATRRAPHPWIFAYTLQFYYPSRGGKPTGRVKNPRVRWGQENRKMGQGTIERE